MPEERLNVIALLSGGKDSFYGLLHCIHHGHRVVALANLYPASDDSPAAATRPVDVVDPAERVAAPPALPQGDAPEAERDLNSFMYQTVGHEVLPLYAAATGVPLFRQQILGTTLRHERDYDSAAVTAGESGVAGDGPRGVDETESMLPLLRAVLARHPEANALCSGAILSTYQRTRVESVALRLGLVPLSYLWKYPVLPSPSPAADEVQLLRDMAAAGLEARIVKVASAGLDEGHLWERVTSREGVDRVRAALKRFGAAEGAALGEGGEFETIVVDGPPELFKRRVVVPESGRRVVREGGGSSWLALCDARLEDKPVEGEAKTIVQEPLLMDAKFERILEDVALPKPERGTAAASEVAGRSTLLGRLGPTRVHDDGLLQRAFLANAGAPDDVSIQEETRLVVDSVRAFLASKSLDPSQITNTIIILRDMADFPKVNGEYGKLFVKPNPPSRITISCGSLLPAGRSIALYLTVPDARVGQGRDGLHVQSRSYWAPANIGPYSQAIDIPVSCGLEATGIRAVYVAGQIPLLPASMSLPPPSDTSLRLQVVLSLQHLWRIGQELKIQCWTSAVVYFARPASADEMERKAELAGQAWATAHAPPDEDDEAKGGPDLWDLKYNPQFMSLSVGEGQSTKTPLPDWSIFTMRQQNEPESCIPPLFSVEIESLPRGSDVEWHAHVGLKQLGEGIAEIVYVPQVGVEGWRGWHTIVQTASVYAIYTVLALGSGQVSSFAGVKGDLAKAYAGSMVGIGVNAAGLPTVDPYLIYADLDRVEDAWKEAQGSAEGGQPFAMMPCFSIRSMRGERLGCLALFRTVLGALAS
ncbi:Diphthine--ammonia ligase [Purpureocillium takamizusanense]|uniref:Diphthine--ammonia ligase n=1 Tax=Purpureocillium takamizusanense TaxID=2060973 RepID=A0A9Q8V647_9HYPO|nr:Diphthine--ammonia ligase [Purpureocillium takamizusanense]UNI14465.1 Diphthine--ammonia ligase [Purpureocillium takamizusanense]